jgi:hypothetical protein
MIKTGNKKARVPKTLVPNRELGTGIDLGKGKSVGSLFVCTDDMQTLITASAMNPILSSTLLRGE